MGQVATIEPPSVLGTLASHYGMDKRAFVETMKATVMGGTNVSNEQLAAFCLVAKEHRLNPFTKEIFAFPQRGGIVPVVSVDGWMKLINSHPDFDGMDFVDERDGDKLVSVTCRMYRKNHSHPVAVTEYMAECRRDTDVWRKWPARMLRHKAAIQAARYAFGFAGIYEPDEAERMEEVRGEATEVVPDRLISDDRKQRCDDAADQYEASVVAIKECIEKEDWIGMTEAWSEIPPAAQMDLYLAPTKGGIFTTHERKCIKERQVREPATSDNPDFPLEAE
jgi:phage recombination protein Bet